MERNPDVWISALSNSHERLRVAVEPLTPSELEQRSYDSDWSIAQVLSHLGSQAEIFSLFLDAALSGQEPPGREIFPPIWEAWNGRSPQAQAADGLAADGAMAERFEGLDAEQKQRMRLSLFGMDLDAAGVARIRVGEHAIHTWDVVVALDPAATVAPDAVSLLIDTVGQLVARAGKSDGKPRRVLVSTTSPERQFLLETGEGVTLSAAAGDESLPELRLPAEAFLRLVYGRLDQAHTPPVQAADVDLDDLRHIFPGF